MWISDDLAGPWRHRSVLLPEEETVVAIYPVEDGVLWLTTAIGMAGGRLYRSEDDGAHWTQLPITST